ncbi:hypothetical protein BH11ARM2_BH11ARM2_23440 [soil metagenome]
MPDDLRAEALLHESCGYIETIHGVEGRAGLIFAYDALAPGTNGEHYQALEVVVSTGSQHPVLTTIHEIGHVLDGSFLNSVQTGASPTVPPGFYASDMAERVKGTELEGSTLLCGWFSAIRASAHPQALQRALAEDEMTDAMAKEIRKLLRVRELWARSYELFVARRHPGSVLAAEMGVECNDSTQIGSIVVTNYWMDDDFSPIEVEIERLLRRLGWLMK